MIVSHKWNQNSASISVTLFSHYLVCICKQAFFDFTFAMSTDSKSNKILLLKSLKRRYHISLNKKPLKHFRSGFVRKWEDMDYICWTINTVPFTKKLQVRMIQIQCASNCGLYVIIYGMVSFVSLGPVSFNTKTVTNKREDSKYPKSVRILLFVFSLAIQRNKNNREKITMEKTGAEARSWWS